ncbi:MAG: hypothetical protein V2A71_03730 [Candidatus Eisenbacteria bacterium]
MKRSLLWASVLALLCVGPVCSGAEREELAPQSETYKPRDLVEARYGDGENEFGLKDYGGEYLGALFFAVGSDGAIYIYDGVEGNIKVFGSDGAFVKTIKAVPWQVGVLRIVDMTVTPNGNIFVLCETFDPQECYKVFLTAAGMDTVKSVPIGVPAQGFCHSEDGYRVYSAAGIVSDQHGSVYLMDRRTWKSLKLVDGGKVLSDSAQLSTLREGVARSAGGFLSYRGRKSKTDTQGKLKLLDETGALIRDLSHLPGLPIGTDGLGNVYLKTMGSEGNVARISKYSPEGRVQAVIDIPGSSLLTKTYGKGDLIVAADGSIYEMIGARESVRVLKWESAR